MENVRLGTASVEVGSTKPAPRVSLLSPRVATWDAFGRLNYPFGIAVDSKGRIIVSDTLNHRIQIFNGEGNWLTPYATSKAPTEESRAESRLGLREIDKIQAFVRDDRYIAMLPSNPQNLVAANSRIFAALITDSIPTAAFCSTSWGSGDSFPS